MQLRDYQVRAVSEVEGAWQTARRVCLVIPTGGGKTRVGQELVQRQDKPTLWVAHRRELVQQAAERLRQALGHVNVGIIAAGQDRSPHAPVQVASIQTLVAREERPAAGLLVFDECHHVKADTYAELANAYSDALQLGLTATPERQDGSPLGDMYDALVVGAQYSELLSAGHLVPCRVFQPPEIPKSSELAQSPLPAWQRYAEGRQTFGFCHTVALAERYAEEFRQAGIPAESVSATTAAQDRHAALERFRRGELRVLWNVYVFTEGTDVPAASAIVLASGCGHSSGFLQRVGRGLRPCEGKSDMILIDLSGSTLVHGMPTEDRIYSLEGKAITRTSVPALRVCPQCGATILAAYQVCPECSFTFPRNPATDPFIWDWALKEVFAGKSTPDDAKTREYERLRKLQKARGWSLGWVKKEYMRLFQEKPEFEDVTPDEWREEFRSLKAFAAERGYKPGFAYHRFKDVAGRSPARDW